MFGILSLVDWAGNLDDSKATPICPSYEYDAFQLGLDILARIPWRHSTLDLLAQNLRLATLPSHRLKAARLARHISQPLVDCTNAAAESWETLQHHRINGIQGYCLREDKDGLTFEAKAPASVDPPKFRIYRWPDCDYQTSEGVDFELTVILPQNAQTGDWCLFYQQFSWPDIEWYGEWLVLLARPRIAGNIFIIVGKGLAFYKAERWNSKTGPRMAGGFSWPVMDPNLDITGFHLYCIAEDALVLVSGFDLRAGRMWELSKASIRNHLETSVCARPGDSFAVKFDGNPDWL